MISQIFNYLILIRPVNCFITFITVLFGGLIISVSEVDYRVLVLASTAAMLITAAGNVINDIFDVEIDKIAHPNRPIPLNKISIRNATYFYFILNFVALALIIQSYLDLILISITAILLLYVYSKIVKKIFLLSNVTVAFLTGLTFVYAGVTVNNIKDSFLPALFAFSINLNREIVKDIQDLNGDINFNVNSIPIVLGLNKTRVVLNFLLVSLIITTIIPFLIGHYNIEYFVVIMTIVNPILVYCLKLINENLSAKNLKTISRLLKLNMLFGLVAIYFGK